MPGTEATAAATSSAALVPGQSARPPATEAPPAATGAPAGGAAPAGAAPAAEGLTPAGEPAAEGAPGCKTFRQVVAETPAFGVFRGTPPATMVRFSWQPLVLLLCAAFVCSARWVTGSVLHGGQLLLLSSMLCCMRGWLYINS